MNILFFLSNKFMQNDVIDILRELGHTVTTVTYVFQDYSSDDYFAEKLENRLRKAPVDIVFSLNFYPVISDVCYQSGIRYVSWVYDSPTPTFYRFDRSTNRIFLFDRTEYEKYRSGGHDNIFHLPLGVNTTRLEQLLPPLSALPEYRYDISFVGALYNKYNLDTQNLTDSDYAIGILKGYAAAQTQFQDIDLLTPLLQKSSLTFSEDSYSELMKDMLIETTSQERHNLLRLLSNYFSVDLFSTDKVTSDIPVHAHGAVNYENEMPFIFRNSRINLNISLRTIKTAIPLRIFDIMACGGFLITNPQKELFDYFEPDVDFVTYCSQYELLDKCSYYLNHEKERFQISLSAYRKIKEAHTLRIRLQKIFEVI